MAEERPAVLAATQVAVVILARDKHIGRDGRRFPSPRAASATREGKATVMSAPVFSLQHGPAVGRSSPDRRSDNQERDLELLARIRRGDEGARDEMVLKYAPMARRVARQYYARSLDCEDLYQEGLIGLLNAVQEYRSSEAPILFSSFAYICISRRILNVVKHSNGLKEKILNDALSLSGSAGTEESRTLLDVLSADRSTSPEEVVEEKVSRQQLDGLLRAHLSDLEYTVVQLLVRGYSLSEIQREAGVNSKAADNARTRARAKIRRLLERYGSLYLSAPAAHQRIRRRRDLYSPVSPHAASLLECGNLMW